MRRYAFIFPLALLGVTAAAWIRTTWYDEYVHYQWIDSQERWWDVLSLGSASGKLVIGRSRTVVRYSFSDGFNYRRYDRAARKRGDRGPMAEFLGFEYWPRDYDHDTGWLTAPYWFIASMLALAALAGWHWRMPCAHRCGGFPVRVPRR